MIWAGFAVTLLASLTYVPVFVRYPATRDFPWPNLLLFVAGGWMLAAGLKRAYSDPDRYGGKVSGTLFGVLFVAGFSLFCWFNFVFAHHLPSATDAPQVGQMAPDFRLADASGKSVALAELRRSNRAVLLVFYRGYW